MAGVTRPGARAASLVDRVLPGAMAVDTGAARGQVGAGPGAGRSTELRIVVHSADEPVQLLPG